MFYLHALSYYLNFSKYKINLEKYNFDFTKINRIIISACGTAYFMGW